MNNGPSRSRNSTRRATDAAPRNIKLAQWSVRILLLVVPVILGIQWSNAQLARDGEVGFPMDDPYIHFQFARNLSGGQGFSFNPGEPSPGATSPLWVVVLALGHLVGAPIPGLALGLGVILTGVAAWLPFEVGLQTGFSLPLAALAGVAAGAGGRATWASLSGMEIGLATTLSLILILAMQSKLAGKRRAALLGLISGLAATARPEMAILGPL